MVYIDKSVNEEKGRQIIDDLLDKSWCNIDFCYKGADFDGLSKPNYRKPILQEMLNEQNSLCCYCMKEIVNDRTTTLEHIIPHKIKEGEFAHYLVVAELANNVIHKNSFDRSVRVIPPPLYPHDIAYHNLIASCDSKSHCNNFRGDKKIKPLIYNEHIEELVEYDKAGNVYCDVYEDDLEMLGLSLNNTLRLIRKIWHDLATQFADIRDITDEIINDVIYRLVALFDGSRVVDDFIGEPSYKDEVWKYKWFFKYYKSQE